jgi:type II secretory pathway component PulC
MEKSKFPPGWDEARVRDLLAHYEQQTEEEAVAEDEAAYEATNQTMIGVPVELVPAVRELLARHAQKARPSAASR